ncbi:hypothetical protein [Streptomyces sp. NPDC001851]|uniref:hypothetical protein n=1 Tax=Streptomyces sp. NPDC001851 TaxID=3154529 RepID=UPI00332AB5C9
MRQTAGSVVAAVRGWPAARRRQEKARQDAGRVLWLVAAPALAALAARAVGWSLASFTVREYPGEVGARRRLEAHKGQRGTS